MNDEELRSTIEEVKAQVKAKPENKDKTEDEIDEIILDGFFKAYTEGEMSKEDLGAIAQAMGYELDEEFEGDPAAPDMVSGDGQEGGADEASKEELEDLRTIDEGESKEEFKDKIEDVNERDGEAGDEEEVEEESEEEVDDDDEEGQRKKASELFKMDLSK